MAKPHIALKVTRQSLAARPDVHGIQRFSGWLSAHACAMKGLNGANNENSLNSTKGESDWPYSLARALSNRELIVTEPT